MPGSGYSAPCRPSPPSETLSSPPPPSLPAADSGIETLARFARSLENERTARLRAEAAREDAETTARAKSELVSDISHKIRTPLNGVMGTVELLRATRLDREQRGHLETLNQAAEALLSVINEVLDFSAIESGHLRLDRRSFNPLRLLQDTVALVRPQADSKGLNLLLWAGRLPAALIGDPSHLQQVCLNLLSNALRFTDRGEVRIEVNTETEPDDRIRLRVSVRDTGSGIARDRQSELQNALTGSSIAKIPGTDGLGLSLPITARLVRAMGGSLDFESEPGIGTRFAFSALLDATPTETDIPADSLSLSAQLRNLRVLVAEDNAVNQTLAMAVLAKFGIRATLARDGDEAFQAVQKGTFDVVLMDIQMPRMDGLEATRAIRALPANRPQPWIIAVTANALEQDRDLCYEAGMNDFVSKPFRQEALRDALLHAARLSPDTERR